MIVDVSALPKDRHFDALKSLIMDDDCVIVGTELERPEDHWIVDIGWADELLAGVDLDDRSKWGEPIGEDVEGYLSEALDASDERHEDNARRWLVSEMVAIELDDDEKSYCACQSCRCGSLVWREGERCSMCAEACPPSIFD